LKAFGSCVIGVVEREEELERGGTDFEGFNPPSRKEQKQENEKGKHSGKR